MSTVAGCHLLQQLQLISVASPGHRYVDSPAENEAETGALGRLLDACLDSEEGCTHARLATALTTVSAQRAAGGRAVVVGDQPLAALVADTVGALKIKVGGGWADVGWRS